MKSHYENFNKLISESHEKTKYTIYLTKEQKAALYKIKYDYKLSLSTITYILLWHYIYNEKTYKCIQENQYYTTAKNKVTKFSLKIINTWDELTSKYVNNAIIMFVDKIDQKILDPKTYEKLRNELHNKFSNTIDPLWDYNEHYRQNYYVNYYLNKNNENRR